jgi:hypothetical protein
MRRASVECEPLIVVDFPGYFVSLENARIVADLETYLAVSIDR